MPGRSRARNARRGLDDLEVVFSCLANASRRHILLVLRNRSGSMSAGEIASRFACSWPTTTRHLNKLVHARLVEVEQKGRERVYRLDEARLRGVVSGWLGNFR